MTSKNTPNKIAMWVGLEATINRVGDRYINQSEKNNHVNRVSDLRRFAELGIKEIRYPALWEVVCPRRPDEFDWTIVDERFNEMRRLNLKPIAGLTHHGSGPVYTDLNDPDYPEKFALYAQAFAERFPWVEDYTPINEIQATAFFSCLYGHWYPHKRCDRSTVLAIFNQVKATVLAMEAIRKINPRARLIQTEDIGRAQSTPALRYQCEFQNHRRFLAYDFLCGKVGTDHALYDYLSRYGLTGGKMAWLKDHPCPPDILGVNHYLLSNRFLDHRLHLYPSWSHGTNGIDRYADVGVVDPHVHDVLPPTPKEILKDVWERYGIPLAITEAHLSGPREAQMRWLQQIWNDAQALKAERVDIVAVTAWSLLGSYDWNSLCTLEAGFYESGVFDLRTRANEPRETALAQMVRRFSRGENFDHPVLDQRGWWSKEKNKKARPLVITGGRGTLAQAFARICRARDIEFVLLDRSQLDICDAESANRLLDEISPWALINCAGYVRVDEAEREAERCMRENVEGPVNLARCCQSRGVRFITFSSDLVFNGDRDEPYDEGCDVSPLGVYGRSKAESERYVLEILPSALVIRTSSFFGPWDEYNFVTQTLRRILQKVTVEIPDDVIVSPTYLPDLVNTTLDLLIDGERGLVHLVNEGAVSWAQFARLAVRNGADIFSHGESFIVETLSENLNYAARRPKNSALVSKHFRIMPSLENAVLRYFGDLEVSLNL